MSKLWEKSASNLHPLAEKYTVGDDVQLDRALLPFDIAATAAHAKGLQRINILSEEELASILTCLSKLEKKAEQGLIEIRLEDEDCHTVLENLLIDKLGDVGKKIHSGRSRNDQVLVALRLYMKDQLGSIRNQLLDLSQSFLQFAKTHETVPLPGYTHTQQAMLSSLGHYACSFVESLLNDLQFLDAVNHLIDQNPLGSAAGYGVALPLERDFVADELGFNRVQVNSLFCQASRAKFDSMYLECLSQIMLTLGRFANDMILYTSREFDFFDVDDSLVTGSSIMPQKRNLDIMEILRANVSVLQSQQQLVASLSKGLISGYHRDLQLLKKPLMESSSTVTNSIEICALVLAGIHPKQETIEMTIKRDIFTADIAIAMSQKDGIPFRDAYKKAAAQLGNETIDIQENIRSKISLGAPGKLAFEYYENWLEKLA